VLTFIKKIVLIVLYLEEFPKAGSITKAKEE
jgi:hypothetical protein